MWKVFPSLNEHLLFGLCNTFGSKWSFAMTRLLLFMDTARNITRKPSDHKDKGLIRNCANARVLDTAE